MTENEKVVLEYALQLRQDHIDCGKPNNSRECAVALFLTEAKEMPVWVSKNGAWEGLTDEPHKGKKLASFGKKLSRFVLQFDKDKEECSPQRIGVAIYEDGRVFMDILTTGELN